jgi:hypothetical protein
MVSTEDIGFTQFYIAYFKIGAVIYFVATALVLAYNAWVSTLLKMAQGPMLHQKQLRVVYILLFWVPVCLKFITLFEYGTPSILPRMGQEAQLFVFLWGLGLFFNALMSLKELRS